MFHFTIRDLLLLTLVVGLSVGWALDHREQVEHRYRNLDRWNRAEQQFSSLQLSIEQLGYQVDRDASGWPGKLLREKGDNVKR